MKTILIASLILLASCSKSENIDGRIIIVEQDDYKRLAIVKVDNKEYLLVYNGGICPLVKDSTK